MKYIIFGCGEIGKKALDFLGQLRVVCYTDNNHAGTFVSEKKVIPFQDMKDICVKDRSIILVIASEKYWKEMEVQVKEAGIKRYFVFHDRSKNFLYDVCPYYCLFQKRINLSYTQILSHYKVFQYKKFLIYGVNHFIPYLIAELMEQSPNADITIIPQSGYKEEFYSVGYHVYQLEEISAEEMEKYDCIILNVRRNENDIRDRDWYTFYFNRIVDIYDITNIEPAFCHRELKKYKNVYKEKRVFLIGNGPSLKIDDLEKLHRNKEICIAFNKIYRIYDRTQWRADYVGFTDHRVIEACMEDIKKIPGEVLVADRYHTGGSRYIEGVQYYHEFPDEFYPNYPDFSNDFASGFYNGMTVIYDIGIQLAAYMGASEIYLLGVDNSITGNLTDTCNHFLEDYYSEDEKKIYEGVRFEQEKLVKAYEKAEKYSRQHGFRIFNATRGGELEVFERVDFDSLF